MESPKEMLKEYEEKQADVPFYLHENAIMHKDMDNERMMKVVSWMRSVVFVLCAVLVIVVVTLVAYYTSRTQMWNDTISKLQVALVEVCNAKGITPP